MRETFEKENKDFVGFTHENGKFIFNKKEILFVDGDFLFLKGDNEPFEFLDPWEEVKQKLGVQ